MKKTLVALASVCCLMIPTCLSVDTAGLLNLGENVLCEAATSGLPGSGHVDYCSVVNIDLSAGFGE